MAWLPVAASAADVAILWKLGQNKSAGWMMDLERESHPKFDTPRSFGGERLTQAGG